MSSERVPEAPQPARCRCGRSDCLHFAMEYPWCRSCAEHHRAPECTVDQAGYSLATCGCRWDDLDAGLPHRPTCSLAEDDALPDCPTHAVCPNCRGGMGHWTGERYTPTTQSRAALSS